MDPIRGETAESRCNLRAGRVGTRLRGRGCANRALRALCRGGRRRKSKERASLSVDSLEDLGDLQLNRDRLPAIFFMPFSCLILCQGYLTLPGYRDKENSVQ